MKFGEKVRDLRKKHSLTQDELAQCLGINKRTIIGWERDGRYPRSIEMLEKMADIFHVPLTYLQPDQSLFIERAAGMVKFRERQRHHFRRCPCAGIPAIVHAADLLYRREFAERNTLRFPWMHSSSVSYPMRGLFKSRFSLYLWYGRKERLGCPPGFHFRLNFIFCFHLS